MLRTRSILGVAALAVVAVFAGWTLIGTAPAAPDAAPPAIPVQTAQARRQDVPVYLDGLGTVQAFNVVQIKAQVSGNLVALPAKEGQEVHKGDIIAEIDPRPYQAALDQATAKRGEDAAQVQSAQLDLQRYRDLAKRSFAPVQQVDDQQATVNKDTASIAADDAAITAAQINLGYCVIRSPIGGRVSLYQVDVGNLVQAANPSTIVSITQDKPIAVVFSLPENQLAQVEDAAAKAAPRVIVEDSEGKKVLATGVLMTPNNMIDTASGTISLKAKFDNADNHLWPGQFVNARIEVNKLANAVTVPVLAVQHGPSAMFVYVVKPDQTVAEADVQVGYQDGGQAVITKGLTGNETIVLSGQSRLVPGVRVKATDTPEGTT